ncbi:MAG: hypothetical protein ACLP62_15300 [Acidimicrobiales bacterium]
MGPPPAGRQADDWRRTWLTRRAVGLHATVVIVVPAFLALFWWQIQRVREGNTLSWAYVFEWPFFTGYAIYLWWRLVHDQPGLHDEASEVTDRRGRERPGAPPAGSEAPGDRVGASEEDEELAAYNRYLAELAAHDAEQGRR